MSNWIKPTIDTHTRAEGEDLYKDWKPNEARQQLEADLLKAQANVRNIEAQLEELGYDD